MKTLTFEHPGWRGSIYQVELDLPEDAMGVQEVRLPNKKRLELTFKPGYFTIVREPSSKFNLKRLPKAHCIIEKDEMSVTFEGDWETIIPLVNAAAEVNTLFEVVITQEEYEKLSDEACFEEFKKMFSPRAASLMCLFENYLDNTGKPSIQLFRTGRCP